LDSGIPSLDKLVVKCGRSDGVCVEVLEVLENVGGVGETVH